jgi:8-oxo-dGTP pyrophosphatase MutT (NUDIX family)
VTPSLSLARLATLLATRAPARSAPKLGEQAAVAMLLREVEPGLGPEVLLMQRSERAGDPWSGHVSLPGGRAGKGDADLLAAAVRETREEVGLDLERCARELGSLDPIPAMARGRVLPLTITPFVFARTEEQPLTLGAEATSCFWLPLAEAASGRLDSVHEYRLGPVRLELPCWRYRDYVVWGLTYQMLGRLLALAGGD